MNPVRRQIACIGCGAGVPDIAGPTHAYIGASPGCWSVYCDVLAREYGEYNYPDCHRLTVDAYAAQHPGTPSRRSIQSVAVHLLALHILLEQGAAAAEATRRLRRVLQRAGRFTWLEPPSFVGTLNILAVAATDGLAEHERAVHEWAAGVWAAWHPHHATIRTWARNLPTC